MFVFVAMTDIVIKYCLAIVNEHARTSHRLQSLYDANVYLKITGDINFNILGTGTEQTYDYIVCVDTNSLVRFIICRCYTLSSEPTNDIEGFFTNHSVSFEKDNIGIRYT